MQDLRKSLKIVAPIHSGGGSGERGGGRRRRGGDGKVAGGGNRVPTAVESLNVFSYDTPVITWCMDTASV